MTPLLIVLAVSLLMLPILWALRVIWRSGKITTEAELRKARRIARGYWDQP